MSKGRIHYNAGGSEYYLKITRCKQGVEVCDVDYAGKQHKSFIPWTSIRKIEYDENG